MEEEKAQSTGEHALFLGGAGLLTDRLDELVERHLGHLFHHLDGVEALGEFVEFGWKDVAVHEQLPLLREAELADKVFERADVAPEGEDHALDAVEFELGILFTLLMLILLLGILGAQFGKLRATGEEFVVGVAVTLRLRRDADLDDGFGIVNHEDGEVLRDLTAEEHVEEPRGVVQPVRLAVLRLEGDRRLAQELEQGEARDGVDGLHPPVLLHEEVLEGVDGLILPGDVVLQGTLGKLAGLGKRSGADQESENAPEKEVEG